METRLTYKYRIYPTKAQEQFLTGQLREACDLYNAALQERRDAWKTCRKSINYYDQANQLKAMRAEGLIGIENFTCCQEVLRRVDRAYRAFYMRVHRGGKPGFPRYRSVHRYDSITFPAYGNGCKLLDNNRLRIQGAGHIRVKLHRAIAGTIKTVTIKRQAERWYACFSVEHTAAPLPPSNAEVGIDLGLQAFAVLSDGTVIDNPRHGRNAEAHLRRCQRKVTRRKRGSNRRRKAIRELQRAYDSVRARRADFQHKASRQIVDAHGLIAIEHLNVASLAGGMLAKPVRDAGWSNFIRMLTYKAANAGRKLVRVDPRGTSQTCLCGASVPKALSDRRHECPACGLSADRDHISARLILSRAGSRPSGVNVGGLDPCVS